MIVGLRGRIEQIEGGMVELEVGGVFYGVCVSLLVGLELQRNQEVRFLISEIIREDAHLLFGFLHKNEQNIFERLIKISGVGPKVAMAILSTYSAQEFAQVIEGKNLTALQKVPGIGARGASKIMVDLAGFFEMDTKKNTPEQSEAVLALESLGFKKTDIQNVLKKIKATNTADIIKEALQYFR
ncbi:Holliday junction DNA helicase RuvA [Helicobacter enhydrae]|uniref:Holliday junction branch migration complex subunit RuvA n=1 Tax=Helicobacter enhydrae TaxID=222136 RepID=A0A1B1U5L5_9HELI|nr:Holliday junction branch migration protein RuvA [Helicobacter enhydrae]ANV98087.1 Holliday junction DNA helicase RuvA [Helicobacter enhydrae]